MTPDPSRFPLGAGVTLAQLSDNPYPVFQRLRAQEPVTWVPSIGQWLVTSRDVVMDVLRDTNRFRTDSEQSPIRDTFGPQMLSTEGEQQRRYKTACAPPFNARAVEEESEMVQAIVDARRAALPRERAELRSGYAGPIAVTTVARVLGLSPDNDVLLREWYETFADALLNYEGSPMTQLRAHAAVLAFRTSVAPILQSPNPAARALLHQLAAAHPRMLDDEEIVSNALIVLFGGIETTEALITNALWAMLSHPEVLPRARASTDDLTRCIEESMRWEPAVQTCSRYVDDDVTLEGVHIEEGAIVQCMLGAANRDPAHYADPERYDPWRQETTQNLGFGFGKHFCLGAALARLEARLAVGRLLEAYPALRLDPDAPSRPSGHEFRKPQTLYVRFDAQFALGVR